MGKDLNGKELGEGICQRKNGAYCARYVNRFGKRVSLYGKSRIEVKKKLQAAIEENLAQKVVKKRYKVSEWYEIWMRVYKEPVIRPNSQQYYKQLFRLQILPEIGAMYLEEVQQVHVRKLINLIKAQGYQWATQNKVRILLQDLFNVAIINDLAIKNPAKGIKLPRSAKERERVVLDLEQQVEFFECSAGTFYDNLFVVAINTGMRQGELCALEESDLDFEKKEISVTKTLVYQRFDGEDGKRFHTGPPKTDTSVRKIPMNAACEQALKKQLKLKKITALKNPGTEGYENLIFVTRKNNPVGAQNISDAIRKLVEEINAQRDATDQFPIFSSHTFRHTFATRCIEAGIQPKTLQSYLGHATLQMTMDLYVHVTEDFKHEEFVKLDKVMPKKNTAKLQIITMDGIKVG